MPASIVEAARRMLKSDENPEEGGMSEDELESYFEDADPFGFGPTVTEFSMDAMRLAKWIVEQVEAK